MILTGIVQESVYQVKLGGDILPLLLHDFLIEIKEAKLAEIPQKVIRLLRKFSIKILIEKRKSGQSVNAAKFKKP